MTPERPNDNAIPGTTGHHYESLPQVSREFEPDRQAMLAALRVVLGLPRVTSPLARPLRDLETEA